MNEMYEMYVRARGTGHSGAPPFVHCAAPTAGADSSASAAGGERRPPSSRVRRVSLLTAPLLLKNNVPTNL